MPVIQPSQDMTMQEWLDVTLELEREGFKLDPPAMEGDVKADWTGHMLFATVCEIVEMADEVGWKPWSQPRGWVNRDKVIKEATDAMHFIALVLASVECTGDELTTAYMTSVMKNYARQAQGDDVRKRRCPGCGRSLDDTGIELQQDGYGEPVSRFCSACHTRLEEE